MPRPVIAVPVAGLLLLSAASANAAVPPGARSAAGQGGATETILTGVSCAAEASCLAVGTYTSGPLNNTVSVAFAWNGRRWRALPAPAEPGVVPFPASLAAVSCTGPSSCMAVGTYQKPGKSPGGGKPARGPLATLAESWNGRSWQVLPTPSHGTADSMLTAVWCGRTSQCVAAGWYGTGRLLAERWNGRSWTLMKTAGPRPAFGPDAVSCATADDCVAVGAGPDTEAWNGSSWRAARLAIPPGARSVALTGVSCGSPRGCVAVGGFLPAAAVTSTLAEAWSGSAWRLLSTPPAGTTLGSLDAVSCSSASRCVAVGHAPASSAPSRLLAAQWDGTTWRAIATMSVPGKSPAANLFALSCPRPRACTAVGDYFTASSPDTFALAASWTGSAWRLLYP